jgi:hypothetical protein
MAAGDDRQATAVGGRMVEIDRDDQQIEVRVGERRVILVPVEPRVGRTRLEDEARLLQLDAGADQALDHVEDPGVEDEVVEGRVPGDRVADSLDVVASVEPLHHQERSIAAGDAPSGTKHVSQRAAKRRQLARGQKRRDDEIAVRGVESLLPGDGHRIVVGRPFTPSALDPVR